MSKELCYDGCKQEDRAFGHFEGEAKITWCTKCGATFKDDQII